MTAALRGRVVEAEPAGTEETTGFDLEDVVVVEADPEETSGFDPEGATITLDMPSAVAGENWAGKEVEVSGRFEHREGERWVLVVDSIDEA